MVGIQDTQGDQWDGLAETYKSMMADLAGEPMGLMLERANVLSPFSGATSILDNGCGPGPIMTRLLKDYEIPESCSLACCDFSEGMVEQVQATKREEVEKDESSPWSRVEAFVQDAMDLKEVSDSSKSHVTAGWVYFMTPDPQKCLSESRRVLKDGGILACSSWEGSQWMELMLLLKRVRPDKDTPNVPEAWASADLLKAELESAGFKDVETHRAPVVMKFEKRQAFIDFCFDKIPHMAMATKDMSGEEKTKLKQLAFDECVKMSPDEPGELKGTALVAVGRK